MSMHPESPPSDQNPLSKPEALLRVPVGFASPLWGVFAGAAMTGSAWWWMTRWTRTENLEAMFGAAARAALPAGVAEDAAIQIASAQAEDGAEMIEEAVGEISEAAAAAVAAPILEDLPAPIAPVGGEAAPISPALQALPLDEDEAEADEIEGVATLKPRKRTPKAD